MHSRFAVVCTLFIASCSSLTARSSSAPGNSASTATPDENTPTFRAISRLVLVDAVVTGRHGEFIRDLKPADFTVLEDGKLQKISGFSAELSVEPCNIRRLDPRAKSAIGCPGGIELKNFSICRQA